MRDLIHHNEATARAAIRSGGSRYWRVSLTDGEVVFLHAQRAAVEGGALVFYRGRPIEADNSDRGWLPEEWEETDEVVTAFGPGTWRYVAVAGVLDGAEVNWDHHLVPAEGEDEDRTPHLRAEEG